LSLRRAIDVQHTCNEKGLKMAIGILYGTPPSRAARITWLAAEIGVELDVRPVNIFAGEHKSPDYAKVNVLQQVPAFTDDDVAIGESLAITLYLARKHMSNASPQNLAEEAQIFQWTMIAAGIDPQMAPIMTHRVMLPEDKRDNKAVEKTMKALKRALAGVERHLSQGHDWLVADRFTVADINLAGAASVLHFTGLSGEIGPNFAKWLERCLGRPIAQANIMKPMAPPPEMVDRIMAMLTED
jgi:glutathione S-transferase